MLVLLMLGLCGIGIRIALTNAVPYSPDALPTVAQSNSKDLIFVLDAGHGGMDGGCSTADGVPEKGINLNIMLNLRELLEAMGYPVIVTRDSDRSIHDKGIEGIANQKSSDMDNRLAVFNQYENAVCISIHQNQFTDPQYSGAQMFYSDTNPNSEGLAQQLQNQFREMLQPENQREIKLCGTELFLCYYCKNPTVMVECGFLSNPDEAALLKTTEYQQKVAFTIFSALQQWISTQK
ncbi:MAG: N-acetylmuramoyl-L-alanine amidase [Oscillospiraceae bacterium]|nr:N-acetylmuramoyl-L-alanine amidase [Oscillospiraceae bacterium]